tara:strand:+ start:1340 stop:2866 length:1527 start_codon:yes stop_codon:yes gene_type:complete
MAITEQKGMMTPPEKEEEETTETSEFEIPKGAKKVFAELAKIGLSLAVTSGSDAQQLGALEAIQDRYDADAEKQNLLLKETKAANEKERQRRLNKLNNLKETKRKQIQFGFSVLSDSGIESDIDKLVTGGIKIDKNDPKLARYIGKIYEEQRLLGHSDDRIRSSIRNQLFTSMKSGEMPFPGFADLPDYKVDATDKQMRELSLKESKRRGNIFERIAEGIDPETDAKKQIAGMTGTLPPEAEESQIPTSQRIKMVGFATDTERTRLLRDANIKAAAEENVKPVYNERGDSVTGFAGENKDGIKTAQDIMTLMPFMSDAQYSAEDSGELYKDAKDIITFAINQAEKLPEFSKDPEKTFKDVMNNIKGDLSKLDSPAKVEYIKNLKDNKGEVKQILTKTETLEDKLGTKEEIRELINSGEAKRRSDGITFIIAKPETGEVIEFIYERDKVQDWKVIGTTKPGGLGLKGGVNKGESEAIKTIKESGLKGEELKKALDLEDEFQKRYSKQRK